MTHELEGHTTEALQAKVEQMAAARGARTGHTPGPWIVRGPSKPTRDTPEGGDFAIVVDRQVIAETYHRTSRTSVRPAEANAHLIAAAPDLLEALEASLRFIETSGYPHPFNLHYHDECGTECHAIRARAAIAKARGES